MTIKRSVLIIQYATQFSAFLAVIAILFYIAGFKDVIYSAVGAAIIASAAVITLSKVYWVRYMLKNTVYPGILYGVCDNMGLLNKLDIIPDDEVLNDLYHPQYPAEAFLEDNRLSPDVYPSMVLFRSMAFLQYLLPTITIVYGLKRYPGQQKYVYLIAFALFSICASIAYRLKYKRDLNKQPVYSFTKQGLVMENETLLWKDINYWQFIQAQGRGEIDHINIFMKTKELENIAKDEEDNDEEINTPQTITINLDNTLAINKIDFCLLVTFYFYKYGYKTT